MSFLYRRCNNQSFTDCILEELHLVKVVVKTMYRKIRNKSRSELKAAPDYRPHQIAKSIQYKLLSIINRSRNYTSRGFNFEFYGILNFFKGKVDR